MAGSGQINKLVSTTEVLVRFNEADPLGIVWHGHYIRYFEDGREDFGKPVWHWVSGFFQTWICNPGGKRGLLI